jgi:hypothetical protein
MSDQDNKYRDDDDDDDDDVQDTDGFTSIWDLVPGYTQSPLDSMLDKEDATLEQVGIFHFIFMIMRIFRF